MLDHKRKAKHTEYKTKFHSKQPWQTRIECSRQILIPHD